MLYKQQSFCVIVTIKHIKQKVAERLHGEKTMASKCWLYWVGDRKRPDMRSGSGVDRNILSFNRNCYLQAIHLVKRSMSTLAHSFNIGLYKDNGPSQQYIQCCEQWCLEKKLSELQGLQMAFKLWTGHYIWTSLTKSDFWYLVLVFKNVSSFDAFFNLPQTLKQL